MRTRELRFRCSRRDSVMRGIVAAVILGVAGVSVSCGGPEPEEWATGHGGYHLPDASIDGASGGSPGCLPKTCAQLGATCGSAPDGCGGKVTCGPCPSGQTCGGGGLNRCGTNPCAPKNCTKLGASCGYVSDGCSEALDCGTCPPPTLCGGAGKQNQCGCAAKKCTQLSASCGSLPDGCDGKVDCGTCPAGQTCGGNGKANQCGAGTCTAKSCSQLGTSCGLVSDGCSQTLDCGKCTAPATCGGGGKLNQCGCTARTCAQLGVSCGPIDDGCGKTLDCGACTLGMTCGGGGVPGMCGCKADTHPESCEAAAATKPGSIPLGGSTQIEGNLVPEGDKDWFVVQFEGAKSCSFHPRVNVVDVSKSGLVHIVVQSSCGTHLECSEGGTSKSVSTWEFTFKDSCGEHKDIDPEDKASSPTTVRVGVFATGTSTGCLPYKLEISN